MHIVSALAARYFNAAQLELRLLHQDLVGGHSQVCTKYFLIPKIGKNAKNTLNFRNKNRFFPIKFFTFQLLWKQLNVNKNCLESNFFNL